MQKADKGRRSIRLKGYDYTQPGAYFVTICTHGQMCVFGDIINDDVKLSPAGQIAHREWMRLDTRFHYIDLDEFVIMPNHIHGIIIITCRGTAVNMINKAHEISCRAPTGEQFGKPISSSIPTIIRSYKSSVTFRVNRLRYPLAKPLWQRNYFEHIIRNDDELNRARRYILNNPLQWHLDEENPDYV